MQQKRRPSMRSLAVEAGVSVSTISRYLAGQLALKPETEAAVTATLERHGVSAKAGVNPDERPPKAIGLVVPEMANPYFGGIADGIVRAAEEYDYAVLVTSSLNHSRRQSDDVALLLSRGVEGIVYAGRHDSERAIGALTRAGLPTVVLDKNIDEAPHIDRLSIENSAGAYQATAHLLQLGHRRVAFVGGPAHLHSVRERAQGYRQALAGFAVPEDASLELYGDFSEEFGAVALSQMRVAADAPTAVFAASDTIALGILAAADAMGIAIPGDLSVVGFDGVPDSAIVRPRLTTVQAPMSGLAAMAVNLLVERIEDPDRPPRQQSVAVALVVRESTAAPART